MPGGRSDEPLDAGTLEMKVLKQGPQVGEAAPAFAVKTLDGKDLKLEDFKGKVVLLDFWATWCGPCVAEMPSLKSLYDQYGGNASFVMISLSLDEKQAAPKEFAEKNGIKWIQGFVGSWEAPAVQDYGVRGIPSVWLIGPDGKILAKNLRGEAAKQAVGQALSAMK